MIHLDPRRHTPRILVDGLCGVVSNDNLHHAALRNLSESGLSIERPFDPATTRRVVQLEIDLPGIDEIVWASARVTFAHLSPLPGRTADGQPRFWCRAGLRIDGICRRERRLLREYVQHTIETTAH
ncbi:MAG: PilZ domain-containing protein [Kofleriaceae bacterium]